MVSSIRINCSASTYVDKTNSNNNFHEGERLLAGINYKNDTNFNIYKTLLKFDTSKLNNHSIKSAFLHLFVEKIKLTPNHSSDNLIISKNISYSNPSTVNWINYPLIVPSNKYTLKITSKDIGKYIKINITDLVEAWVNNNENYGLTIEPIDLNYTYIVQFASKNSLKPPYLSLTAICHCQDNEYDSSMLYCFSSSKKDNDGLTSKKMYDNIINLLNIQDEKLTNLEKSINNKIDSILDTITDTNNSILNLNNILINTTSEEKIIETISQLTDTISSLNTKIDDLQD